MNPQNTINSAILSLEKRLLPDGGFAETLKGAYRTDATAWAVIALNATGIHEGAVVATARERLAASQQKDGRIAVAPECPVAFWPTPLAILAWQGSKAHESAQFHAIDFLLKTTGKETKKSVGSPVADDTTLKGWPWIENTSSWVEPTALALLALRSGGHGAHPRVTEAVNLFMDRQLPHGGWNYGNRIVYGQELYPQPANTGIALAALAGLVQRSEIHRSLEYAQKQAQQCRSAFSLSWVVLGLSAWHEKPDQAQSWIIESLGLQERYGHYNTSLLSLLITSFFVDGDISRCIQDGAK